MVIGRLSDEDEDEDDGDYPLYALHRKLRNMLKIFSYGLDVDLTRASVDDEYDLGEKNNDGDSCENVIL